MKFTLFLYKILKPSGIPKKSGQFWLDGRAFDVMLLDKMALGEIDLRREMTFKSTLLPYAFLDRFPAAYQKLVHILEVESLCHLKASNVVGMSIEKLFDMWNNEMTNFHATYSNVFFFEVQNWDRQDSAETAAHIT